MNQRSSGPAWPDWQDEGAYAYSMHLTSRGWGWEYLRRNPAFQEDLAATLRGVVSSRLGGADVVSLPANTVDLSRWGVLFCKFDQT